MVELGPLAEMHPVEQAIRAIIGVDFDLDLCVEAVAVLAVLDLHQGRVRPGRKYEHDPVQFDCAHCYNLGEGGHINSAYPCETVERIADALGATP